jgi:hypothetical protein
MLVGLLYVNGSDGVHANVFVPVGPRSWRLAPSPRNRPWASPSLSCLAGPVVWRTFHQAQVSKIERSVNLQLETLERFIMATGGRLRVVATYDDIEIDIALDELAPGDRTETTRIT